MGKKPVNISPAQFIFLYRDEKKSGLEIARFFGIGRTTVNRYIKKFGLQPRTIAEVRKNNHWNGGESQRLSAIELGKKRIGKNNPNYKGGHKRSASSYKIAK